jgi:hypothetical protein
MPNPVKKSAPEGGMVANMLRASARVFLVLLAVATVLAGTLFLVLR